MLSSLRMIPKTTHAETQPNQPQSSLKNAKERKVNDFAFFISGLCADFAFFAVNWVRSAFHSLIHRLRIASSVKSSVCWAAPINFLTSVTMRLTTVSNFMRCDFFPTNMACSNCSKRLRP